MHDARSRLVVCRQQDLPRETELFIDKRGTKFGYVGTCCRRLRVKSTRAITPAKRSFEGIRLREQVCQQVSAEGGDYGFEEPDTYLVTFTIFILTPQGFFL